MGLVDSVSKSLQISEGEANVIIDEQAGIGQELIDNGNCKIDDIEELMYEMGVEPDYLDEFLLRMI